MNLKKVNDLLHRALVLHEQEHGDEQDFTNPLRP